MKMKSLMLIALEKVSYCDTFNHKFQIYLQNLMNFMLIVDQKIHFLHYFHPAIIIFDFH